MSRRIAIACAALLSTAVIASGSAGAQPASDDAGVAQLPDVVLNEIAVDLGFPSDFDGSFVELIDHRANPVGDLPLHGWDLSVCGSISGSGLTSVVTFGPTDFVPAGGTFLIADPTFAADADSPQPDVVASGLNNLEQAGGVVALTDFSNNTHAVEWGDPHPDCAGVPDAGVIPGPGESLQRNTMPPPTWCALPPTPKATNGSC